jgi:hypothetical protein
LKKKIKLALQKMIHPDPKFRISSKKLVQFLLKKNKSESIIHKNSGPNKKKQLSEMFNNKNNLKNKKNIFKLKSYQIKSHFKINLPRNEKFVKISNKMGKSCFLGMLDISLKKMKPRKSLLSKSTRFQNLSNVEKKKGSCLGLGLRKGFDIPKNKQNNLRKALLAKLTKKNLKNSSEKFEICSTHITNNKKRCQIDNNF